MTTTIVPLLLYTGTTTGCSSSGYPTAAASHDRLTGTGRSSVASDCDRASYHAQSFIIYGMVI
jgi:hypothetical protein